MFLKRTVLNVLPKEKFTHDRVFFAQFLSQFNNAGKMVCSCVFSDCFQLRRLRQRNVIHRVSKTKVLSRSYVIGYSGKKPDIPRVVAKDVHWACRTGEKPIIIDARPKREYDLFRIMGAVNVPLDTFQPSDIADIPQDRPVYVCR